MAHRPSSFPADHCCAGLALGIPEGAFRESCGGAFTYGCLAVFGHVPVGLPAPLLDQFKEIYLRQIGRMGSAARGLVPAKWSLQRMVLRVRCVRAGRAQALRLEMAAHGVKLCGFFMAKSDHRMMDPAKRDELFADIGQAINSRGGRFTWITKPISISLDALIAIDRCPLRSERNGSLQLHALWRGTTELELTFPHEIVDLAEEVLRSIRLRGDKPAVVGNVGRGRFHLRM